MDIRQLNYFVAVAENKNFTKAAQKLFISQPSLSRQISILEAEFNVPLFIRSNRQVSLTDAGERLYIHAQTLLDSYYQCLRVMNEYKSSPSGKLTFSMLDATETTIFPIFMKEFAQKYPNITFEYKFTHFTGMIEDIKNNHADIGINLLCSNMEYNNLHTMRIDFGADRLIMVVSSNSLYADMTSFEDERFNTLLGLSCYLYNGWHSYEPFLNFLAQKSIKPTIKYYDALPQFLMQTLNPSSYTLLPENFFDRMGSNKWYHKIILPVSISSLDLALITQKQPKNHNVEHFLRDFELFNL